MRLSASTASLSTTSTPAVSANRLQRPVKARSARTPSPCYGRRDFGGGLIFRDVARLKPRDDDFLHAGGLERGDFRRPDQRALLQHEIALADRMHRGGAERVVRGDGAEFHAASAFSDFSRSRAVISAMMEMAISAGDTAPMASPIGA